LCEIMSMKMKCFAVLIILVFAHVALGVEYYVAPGGSDDNPGTEKKPFKTLETARDAVRESGKLGKESVTVYLREGIYHLDKALVLGSGDSGTAKCPVTYACYRNEKAVISGGMKLALDWKPYQSGIFQTITPAGLDFDQLFVNGERQHMARYPNYDADTYPYNGAAADAFSPARAAKWNNPVGGYIHAMHRARWGGYHYRITGKKPDNNVTYEGGWQNNRPGRMHGTERFVENIFEELDTEGEWYHNAAENTLYYMPDKGVDLKKAVVEVVRLRHLVEFKGAKETPVSHINISGITFRHAARTFMDTKEPLLRSDWAIYRGGALFFAAAEDCSITDCEFDQLGGNTIFASGYNRRLTVKGCHIHGSGASGVCFVGDPKSVRSALFNYGQRLSYGEIDKTPGPKTDDYPAECVVDDCLIHDIGIVEKQAAGVQISMAQKITVRHCSIYDVGRAGINIGEGAFGGHVIEFCDVFDTVLETGDHGSFNSWGRDRFWGVRDAPKDKLAELALLDTEVSTIRNSRWRCDHGWDVDLDDGSSYYEIYNNVFLHGGLKLREGFCRKVYNNISVNSTLHPHVWYENSQDVITGNIWMAPYAAVQMPSGAWGKEVDRNMFMTDGQRLKYKNKNWDLNSIVGDPMFVDPDKGDYRVKPESPALKIGFKNFPMDKFGVQKADLKAIARTPELPEVSYRMNATLNPLGRKAKIRETRRRASKWQGAAARGMSGEDYSAFGVSKEDGGIHLVSVHPRSLAAAAGFQTDDLIQVVNGKRVKTIKELYETTAAAEGKPLEIQYVRAQAVEKLTMTGYAK